MSKIAALFFCLIWALVGQGQPLPGLPADSTAQRRTGLVSDTSEVYLFRAELPQSDHLLADTSLENYFTQYDPIRQGDTDAANLGNLGAASQRLIFQPTVRTGFNLGVEAFDRYRVYASQFAFYRVEQGFTRAFFSQGASQDNTQIAVVLGRNFGPNNSLSFDYRRANNLGLFQHQRTKATVFDIGWQYRAPSGKYQVLAVFAANTNENEDNGGITAEPAENGEVVLIDPVGIDVNLTAAATRFSSREWQIDQHLRLLDGKRQVFLVGRHAFRSHTFKAFDPNPEADSAYYGPLWTDIRGLRNFIGHQALENGVALRFAASPVTDSLGVRQVSTLADAGISYTQHWVDQEVQDTAIQQLQLNGKLSLPLGSFLRLQGDATLGLLDFLGDYRLDARLELNIGKIGTLRGHFFSQRSTPTLLEHQLWVSQREVWTSEFSKPLQNALGASFSLPKSRLAIRADYHLLSNWIFFDSLGIARQSETPASVARLSATSNLRLGGFNFDNQIHLQWAPDDALRLPPWYSTHSLYYLNPIFKKVMLFRIGLDLRLIGPYQPYGFQALTGQFYLQKGQDLPWTPIADAVIGFKVQKFRFAFRLENLLPLLTDQYYYLIAGHPLPSTTFRLAIGWQFVD